MDTNIPNLDDIDIYDPAVQLACIAIMGVLLYGSRKEAMRLARLIAAAAVISWTEDGVDRCPAKSKDWLVARPARADYHRGVSQI